MQVVDALHEDGMLRFLGMLMFLTTRKSNVVIGSTGFSYGTALRATLAAMFPTRIDKMVLDGVLNMDQYYVGR